MIDFACKNIRLEQLVRCSFTLTKTEYNLLLFLVDNDFIGTTNQLSKKMKLERTTIQKAITKLLDKNLVERRQKNLEHGGYSFFYNSKPRKEIRSKIKSIVDEWHKKTESAINKF